MRRKLTLDLKRERKWKKNKNKQQIYEFYIEHGRVRVKPRLHVSNEMKRRLEGIKTMTWIQRRHYIKTRPKMVITSSCKTHHRSVQRAYSGVYLPGLARVGPTMCTGILHLLVLTCVLQVAANSECSPCCYFCYYWRFGAGFIGLCVCSRLLMHPGGYCRPMRVTVHFVITLLLLKVRCGYHRSI